MNNQLELFEASQETLREHLECPDQAEQLRLNAEEYKLEQSLLDEMERRY